MIETIRQGLKEDGFDVSISKLCKWFEIPRRTVYYHPTKAEPKVQEHLLTPIKAMIEENPSFGYRTVAHLLEFNKNTVQPIFQIKGWQVRKWPVGFRPRIKALLSVAQRPNERCATDLCRIWAERDDWTTLALVIDCLPPRAAGLAPVSPRPIEDRGIGARASVDRSIRNARQGATALPSEIRQRPCVHQPKLHGPGSRRWPAPGIHHTVQPRAERHGRARDSNLERVVRAPASVRVVATRQQNDRRLDRLLQQPATSPGARHEDPC